MYLCRNGIHLKLQVYCLISSVFNFCIAFFEQNSLTGKQLHNVLNKLHEIKDILRVSVRQLAIKITEDEHKGMNQ